MTDERSRSAVSGYIGLLVGLAALAGGLWVLVLGVQSAGFTWLTIPFVVLLVVAALSLGGLIVVQPNEARVLVLFGTYHGTVKHNGFFWVNPFYTKRRITLRSRNLNGQKLKVNDKGGNPIEIAAVVVWQVQDTAMALYSVDDFTQFVTIQTETAVRHIASSYPYDNRGSGALSLRSHPVASTAPRGTAERGPGSLRGWGWG